MIMDIIIWLNLSEENFDCLIVGINEVYKISSSRTREENSWFTCGTVVSVFKREAVDFSKPRKDIVIQDLSNSPYRTIYQDVYIQ